MAFERRISDWSSDGCSSVLLGVPATAPGQVLTVSRVDLPTPLDDVRAVYRLEAGAGGEPLLRIASARTDVQGGSVSLPQAVLDLQSEGRGVGKERVSRCRIRWEQ